DVARSWYSGRITVHRRWKRSGSVATTLAIRSRLSTSADPSVAIRWCTAASLRVSSSSRYAPHTPSDSAIGPWARPTGRRRSAAGTRASTIVQRAPYERNVSAPRTTRSNSVSASTKAQGAVTGGTPAIRNLPDSWTNRWAVVLIALAGGANAVS